MTYPNRKASRCLVEWIAGLTLVIQPSERTEFRDAIDTFQFESKYPADNGLTRRVPDGWDSARFLSFFWLWVLSVSTASLPSHPPQVTQTLRRTILESEGKMSAQSIDPDELIANYGNCPSELESAILGLSERHLDIRKSTEDWTIRETIHHIADGDDMWKLFIKRAIGNPNGEYVFDWYWQVPQDEWAKRWSYKVRAIEPSLALFQANRSHIVQLLRHTPGAMEKSLRVRWPTQLEEQDVRVAMVVEGQTQHALAHIAAIREIREVHGV